MPWPITEYERWPTLAWASRSWISSKRVGESLSRYSVVPSRYKRRVIVICGKSTGIVLSSLFRTMVTSAKPERERPSEPEKITSSDFFPRKIFRLCSPKTQRIASAKLDFPEPFGPTTETIGLRPLFGAGKERPVFLAKVLKPWTSKRSRYIGYIYDAHYNIVGLDPPRRFCY